MTQAYTARRSPDERPVGRARPETHMASAITPTPPPPIAGPDTFGVTMLDTDAPASPVASAQQSTEAGAPRQHESARRTPGVSAASRSNSGPQPAAVFGGPAVPPTSPAPDKGFASRSPAVKIATVLFFICAFTILNWALSKPSTPKPKSSLVTRTDTPAANGSSSRAGIELSRIDEPGRREGDGIDVGES